jgi:hypothetical protein
MRNKPPVENQDFIEDDNRQISCQAFEQDVSGQIMTEYGNLDTWTQEYPTEKCSKSEIPHNLKQHRQFREQKIKLQQSR